jgi:MoaA/NifB/PqqE/SkfB family radical SAM enzyme
MDAMTATDPLSPGAAPSAHRPSPPQLGHGPWAASADGLRRPPLPRFVQIEPIGRCNLDCRMCAVNERADEVGEMPLERFRELLDAMPGLEQVHLQGLGEPMLHPRFFDMVALAASRGLWVSANTNLTLLTEARAERCVTSGLAALSVSLDGASAPVYEAIRRKASFPKVLRNLRRLTDARDRYRSPLGVRGVMVLMRSNLHELPAMVELLHAHGVGELLVQRLVVGVDEPAAAARPGTIPIRDYTAQAELSAADLPLAAERFDQARERAAALGLQLHLPRLRPVAATSDMPGPRCTWPWEQSYITAAGEMLPCCMVGTADRASFGKVYGKDADQPARPLAAWHGAPAQAFREALARGPAPVVCQGCALYHQRF